MSKSGVSEMTHYVKTFASKTGDLSFNPIIYTVKKRTHSCKFPLTSIYSPCYTLIKKCIRCNEKTEPLCILKIRFFGNKI